jgi:hypothetical protein
VELYLHSPIHLRGVVLSYVHEQFYLCPYFGYRNGRVILGLKTIGFCYVDWIHMAQDMVQCWAVASTAMIDFSFSGRTLLHGGESRVKGKVVSVLN